MYETNETADVGVASEGVAQREGEIQVQFNILSKETENLEVAISNLEKRLSPALRQLEEKPEGESERAKMSTDVSETIRRGSDRIAFLRRKVEEISERVEL